jgi:hypothetical protein
MITRGIPAREARRGSASKHQVTVLPSFKVGEGRRVFYGHPHHPVAATKRQTSRTLPTPSSATMTPATPTVVIQSVAQHKGHDELTLRGEGLPTCRQTDGFRHPSWFSCSGQSGCRNIGAGGGAAYFGKSRLLTLFRQKSHACRRPKWEQSLQQIRQSPKFPPRPLAADEGSDGC